MEAIEKRNRKKREKRKKRNKKYRERGQHYYPLSTLVLML